MWNGHIFTIFQWFPLHTPLPKELCLPGISFFAVYFLIFCEAIKQVLPKPFFGYIVHVHGMPHCVLIIWLPRGWMGCHSVTSVGEHPPGCGWRWWMWHLQEMLRTWSSVDTRFSSQRHHVAGPLTSLQVSFPNKKWESCLLHPSLEIVGGSRVYEYSYKPYSAIEVLSENCSSVCILKSR